MTCDGENDDDDALKRVLEFAANEGFHGVLMLSGICPKCGRLHNFRVVTDYAPGDGFIVKVMRHGLAALENVDDAKRFHRVERTRQ